MKWRINISLKQRIYLSFSLLVILFVLNGIITLFTMQSNKKIAIQIFKVISPSLQALDDFDKMMLESRAYTTNWVFLEAGQEDKKLLIKLHDAGYQELKSRIDLHFSQLADSNWIDSLNRVYSGFEELLVIEKEIMRTLNESKDYDNPVIKLEATRKLEEDIIPRTITLMNSLGVIHDYYESIRSEQSVKLERTSMILGILVIILTITIILAGLLLSVYMTKVIINPIDRIRHIIDNLGRGITQKVSQQVKADEIGSMIHSVNNLSEKLEATADFAQEIGRRNFDFPFKPLSNEDSLGKSLMAMRDCIKSSDEKLNEAQHIARLGSWERNIETDKMTLTDEMFNIFDIDPLSFDYRFQSILQLVHPDDIEIVTAAIERNHKMAPAPFECRIVTSKGIIKSILVETKVRLGKNGEIEETFGILQDITERKKAEEALSNNELRFRTLTSSAPVGIFQTDREGKTIYVNETWLDYTGMSFSEAIGYGWIASVYPDDLEMLTKGWNDKAVKGVESTSEYRLIDKKGNKKWVMGKSVPIFNKSGELLGHIGTVSDVTERKLAIESLQQSEMKYRQIVETAQEGIWLIDENNYTIFANKKMSEMLEYSQEEMMGKQNYFFKDEDEKKKAAEQIGKRKKGVSETHDAKFLTKSGKTVWASVSTNPVFDDAGIYKGALGMMTNISQRKHDEELLYQSKIILAEKNKELESKNKELEQFAYVASHDLQEPLRTTLSFVELFQQQYKGKLDDKADKYLSFITQSAGRMEVLIKDLLDYSRIGHKKELQKVDCNKIMKDVLLDLTTAIQETRASIQADPLPVISAYPTEIKQLFQNLITNAIKFVKKDTVPEIKISVKELGDHFEFSFKDNGIGIDHQHAERIFVIFQRLHTRAEYIGSGIGLSHCKKIVELHNGRIWVESTPGKGSTFHFTISKINK